MSLAYLPSERRVHPRHPISLDAYITPDKDKNYRLKAKVINLSLLGCAITPVEHPLKTGDCLDMCFVANRDQCSLSTIIRANIVHISNEYIGLSFDTMGAEVMDVLRELLKNAKYF